MTATKASQLAAFIKEDQELYEIIRIVSQMGLPNLYVAGGCVSQTVWNKLFDLPIGYGISDVDIVYFSEDTSEAAEDQVIQEIKAACGHLNYEVDVKNEARVHLWYEARFGKSIPPYTSTEDAISSWPSTGTCAGVYLDQEGQMQVYTTFGYEDIFSGIVRPNKRLISQEVYEAKAAKWLGKWPQLTIIPW